jgi:hypothetical protein
MWASRTIARTRRTTLRTLESTGTARPTWATLRTTLENRLASNRNTRTCACTHRRLRWRRRTWRLGRRSGVHRTRTGLRNDHAAAWRLLAQWHARQGTLRCARRGGHRCFCCFVGSRRRRRYGCDGCFYFRSFRGGARRSGSRCLGNISGGRKSLHRSRTDRCRRRSRSNRSPRRCRTLRGN